MTKRKWLMVTVNAMKYEKYMLYLNYENQAC